MTVLLVKTSKKLLNTAKINPKDTLQKNRGFINIECTTSGSFFVSFVADSRVTDGTIEVPCWWVRRIGGKEATIKFVDNELNLLDQMVLRKVMAVDIYPLSDAHINKQLAGAIVSPLSIFAVIVYKRIILLEPADPEEKQGLISENTKITILQDLPLPFSSSPLSPSYSEFSNPLSLGLNFSFVTQASAQIKTKINEMIRISKSLPDHFVYNVLLITKVSPKQESLIIEALKTIFDIIIPPLDCVIKDAELNKDEQVFSKNFKEKDFVDEFVLTLPQCNRPLIWFLPDFVFVPECFLMVNRILQLRPRSIIISFSIDSTPLAKIREELGKQSISLTHLDVKITNLKTSEPWANFMEELKHDYNVYHLKMNHEESLEAIKLSSRYHEFGENSEFKVLSPQICKGWNQIYGYIDVKKRLYDLVYKFAFGDVSLTSNPIVRGLPPVRGILLWGPSGCGKSALARAICSDGTFPVIQIHPEQVLSRYFGDSEAILRKIFEKARSIQPSIVLIEDIEFLGARRSSGESDESSGVSARLLSTLLNEMDGIGCSGQVLIIASTENPSLLDEALIRPGRLDHHIKVGLPTDNEVLTILEGEIDRLNLNVKVEDIERNLNSSMTCADLLGLVNKISTTTQNLKNK